jgi:hypothetical protein
MPSASWQPDFMLWADVDKFKNRRLGWFRALRGVKSMRRKLDFVDEPSPL